MCYECLLRIEEYDGSIKSAGPYIPAVEEMGFMEEVDTIVLKKVYSDLKNNPNIVLSFNVSNYTVENGNLLPLLEEMMQDYDIASRVIVEITETGVQRNLNKVAYFIAILQGLGCKVALDDFGAGYTSFKQLKALPVDIIKIDGSFIQNMSTNADNRLFVEMLLKFTKNFGLTTIAEYVETGDVAKTLMEMEVNYLQGYYFSPAVNYKPWLSNNQDNEQLL
jgi:EAL domain-containing protein (putative c-di-GMP-specific phosphodiesterase class I)